MMRIVAAAALIATAFAAQALELKGIALGTGRAQLVAQFPGLRCPLQDKPEPRSSCEYVRRDVWQDNITPLNTIAGELVDEWRFEFIDGRLARIEVLVPHASFETVRSAIEEKLGRPGSRRVEHLHNAMGATFDGALERWARVDGTAELREYAGSILTSSFEVVDRSFPAAARRDEAADTRRRAGDL